MVNRAQTIAQRLLAAGLESGDVVAVSGGRSFGLIASVLGVMQSGGVLLLIDPQLPYHRQQLMLTEANAKYLAWVDSKQVAADTGPQARRLSDCTDYW